MMHPRSLTVKELTKRMWRNFGSLYRYSMESNEGIRVSKEVHQEGEDYKFESWGIADGSGLLVRDKFGRFVVSASTATPGQGGGDADAGGAVCGDENLGASTEGGFDDVMADMEAMA